MNTKGENSLDNKPYKLDEKFSVAELVTWKDAVEKINQSYKISIPWNERGMEGPLRIIYDQVSPFVPATFDCEDEHFTDSFLKIRESMPDSIDREIENMHVYISLCEKASTFERHNDDIDVMILQSIGTMRYKIDGIDNEVVLTPGEAVYIPKFVYHEPIVDGPRVTISFGMKDNNA